jgi:cell division protein FtsL
VNISKPQAWFWHLTGHKIGLTAIIAINIVAAFFYLTQTNLTATQGYQIKIMEKQLTQLEREHDKLSLDYVELQSMDRLINSAKNFNLVPSDNIETLRVEELVAINR